MEDYDLRHDLFAEAGCFVFLAVRFGLNEYHCI